MSDFDYPDFDSIVTPIRKLLERDIQSACVRWMRARGYWARKFSSPQNNAVPDYIFGRDGFTLFVEFKAPGKKPTELQEDEHKLMRAAGLGVHVMDDIEVFKHKVLEWEREATVLSQRMMAA